MNSIWIKFIPKYPALDILDLITAWHQTGDKPLPEAMWTTLTGTYMRHQALTM